MIFYNIIQFQAHNHLKVRLTNMDILCLKNKQNKRWSLSDSPTITEDLHQSSNGDPYSIVRNSDFLTLSRSAHAGPAGPHLYTQYNPGPQYIHEAQHIQDPQYIQEAQYIQDAQYTLGPQYVHQPSVPGPQVNMRAPIRAPLYTLSAPQPYHHMASQRTTSPGPPGQHIYMEVDPLYCSDSGQLQQYTTGLASSSSSQASSGYSSAGLSEHLRPGSRVLGVEGGRCGTETSRQLGTAFNTSQEQQQYSQPVLF